MIFSSNFWADCLKKKKTISVVVEHNVIAEECAMIHFAEGKV